MKRIIAILAIICATLCLSGCGIDLDDAAREANKAIGGTGNALHKPGQALNEIVDDFISNTNF